ncbi:MAG TPA: hypothetical protein VGM54_07055 [Chthoniobacter sp.]|jgi:hypothetical protein
MVKVAVVVAWFAFLALRPAHGALSEETPAEFANRFYHAYGELRVRGVPNERQRRALAPFFTLELQALLAKADRCRGSLEPHPARPNKPGCGGDLFTSNSSGWADTYAIGFPQAVIGRLIQPIHLADAETGDAWVDRLMLHHGNGRWFIADIVFTNDRGNRLFGKGSLRRALKGCLHR